jgi:dephospho-CoA kinase
VLRIGLTGGIGSGKTTVAKIFEQQGIPVYYADDEAKRLVNSNLELKAAIQKHFGQEAYTNGELNRKLLASIVFTDKYKLELLNALIHPVTIQDASEWMKKQNSPYAIKEAALLFEAAAAQQLDYIIGVQAPLPLRIKRTMARNHVSHEEVMKRINNQLDETIKMKLCDFVIQNDERELVIPQVLALHERLIELANEKQSSA